MRKEKLFFIWLMVGVSVFNLGFIKIFRPPASKKQAEEKKPYLCQRAKGKITIDGKLEEEAWKSAYLPENYTNAGELSTSPPFSVYTLPV
ncbi:MAG: hypothetical protein GXO71_07765 [Caldiserica bacterium]|nr:hypothetical protein [Caldisericota bacterium]